MDETLKCWTGCGQDVTAFHRLDDRAGTVGFCDLHSLEHTIDRRDPDALDMLADAFDAAGRAYDAYRHRFYAAGIRALA